MQKNNKIKAGILVLSDRASRGEREDLSGLKIKEIVEDWGWECRFYQVIPDEKEKISAVLKEWCDMEKLDVILTTGGTGVHPRDVTPEATKEVIEKEIPGIAEYMRYISYPITPLSALSRGIAGIRKETLILNLPGSPKAIEEILPELKKILFHAIEKIKGDTSECAGKV